MATIFVSHSSQDADFANRLAEDLRLIGHVPWIDTMEIRPGESILSAIQDGISLARYAIVIVSSVALQSGWVDTEWKAKLWDSVATKKIGVIPVLKDAGELPVFLRGLRYADFTKSYPVGFATLCLTFRPAGSQVPQVIDIDLLHAIEHSARTAHEDHLRVACAHTVWSFRPDRAKPILEDALHDMRDVVRIHAQVLLDQFY